ncbi:cutinase family protein [Nocardia transvalensis]|uniref:cutinase family protein n=1 Tax=Nocardia transvalensis TaxID=37333 RepID=UPI00189626A6|nr:cutinase family protein [Nocardia transvalensis]MBF6331196.1 cutinase family protein [Nocardia transvalensis]
MALREFFARHRIATAAAAPAVLGVAAIVAATFTVTSSPRTDDTQLKASVTECHDMVTISVAGRGDTPKAGTTKLLVGPNGEELPAAMAGDHNSTWVDPVVNAPDGAVNPDSYAAVYIAYPANMATYEDAVNSGAANTERVMTEIRKACPDTKFAIVGYSEGADVVRRVAMKVGNQQADKDGKYGIVDPNNVVGVVILADSGRAAGDGPFPGAKDPTRPDNFDQKYQNGVKPVSGQGALPGTSGSFGALNGKVASFCSEGDLTCAAPQNISLLQLVVNVGRQINADKLEKEGLNPATGQDVAAVLGRIAVTAFADIAAQPNWMASDETFLQVLLRVSDPAYKPGQAPKPVAKADAIEKDQMSPLAYLPQKIFNEIIGLIVTNQNTIPVIMSDPYQLTLGPNATGHHFDYWRNADPANGRPMTSAEYAAAWLTHLAKEAQAGKQPDTNYKPNSEDLAAAYKAAEDSKAARTSEPAKATTTTSAAPTTTGSSTTSPTSTTPSSTTAAPSTTASTTTAPTTSAPTSATPTTSPSRTSTATSTSETTTAPAPSSTTQTTNSTTTAPATTTPGSEKISN